VCFCDAGHTQPKKAKTMANTYQGIKSSSINASNPHAERELTLSEIDSMYQNSEISADEAKAMAVNMASDYQFKGSDLVFVAVLRK